MTPKKFVQQLVQVNKKENRSSSSLAINTLRPRQIGRDFTDDIFKHIFLNENVLISIKIALKFIPNGPVDNISALVQIMTCWTGDKPLSEPMVT